MGISVLYNTDQYLQGKQLLDAAETRNTNAEIDKIVDFHNEALNEGYEIIGTITTAYCGTLMMGTLTYSLGGGNVTFLSATADTGEDLLTDYLAGNIDEALGGGSPLRSLLISSLLSGGINASRSKITGGGGKGTFDVDAADVRKAVDIDTLDVRTAVKDIDMPDVRNAVDNIDAPDVRNVVNDIDASDIKNAVKDIEAPDVTSGKYSLLGEMPEADGKAYERFLKEGPQEGITQAEIIGIYKADRRAALNVINQNAVSGKGVEGGSTSVKHAVSNANQAQSVLDGINPKYFNPDSRFGGGFYVGADGDTIVAELAEHGNIAQYSINYDMNLAGQKILDLTNPTVALDWGYFQNRSTTKACQNIGEIARQKGYNVIKFQSYRGSGTNYVIFNNFDSILIPRMVTPID